MMLSEFFNKANIQQYAEWSSSVPVTPSGREDFAPRHYQIAALNHMVCNLPRAANWSDPGTGKTLVLQAFMLLMAGLGNKSVAVMPPTLVEQFNNSFHRDFPGFEQHISFCVISSDIKKRVKQIEQLNAEGWPDMLLMSYNVFVGTDRAKVKGGALESKKKRKLTEEDQKYQWAKRIPITGYNFRWEVLTHLGYNLLITDESHKLKNVSSSVHKAVKMFAEPWLGDSSNGLILSTGSPIETNVEDAYGLINLLDPKRYGTKHAFDSTHCDLDPFTLYRKVRGYRNLNHLYQGLYAKGYRITKQEAFPEMPPVQYSELIIDLYTDHKALYNKLVDEQVLNLQDTLIDATKQQRMYQYVQQILLRPDKFTDKAPKKNAMLEAIDGILDGLGDRKVLVYAWYTDSIEMLKQYYKTWNPAVVNGSVTGAKRELQKMKFIADDSCRMAILNPVSGGVGIDGFQGVCSYAIFAEVFPHPGGFHQAVGRLDRSGQKETVSVYLLVPKDTIAVKLRNDLCRKEGDIQQVVQDKRAVIEDMLGKVAFAGKLGN